MTVTGWSANPIRMRPEAAPEATVAPPTATVAWVGYLTDGVKERLVVPGGSVREYVVVAEANEGLNSPAEEASERSPGSVNRHPLTPWPLPEKSVGHAQA